MEKIKEGYYKVNRTNNYAFPYNTNRDDVTNYTYCSESIDTIINKCGKRINKDLKESWSRSIFSEIKYSPLVWCEVYNGDFIKINKGYVDNGILNIDYETLDFKWLDGKESKFIHDFVTKQSSYKEKKQEVIKYNSLIEEYCKKHALTYSEHDVLYGEVFMWDRYFKIKIPNESCLSVSYNPERKLLTSNFKIII